MEGSVLSFFKAEWKVSNTGSAHWASTLVLYPKGDLLIQVWLLLYFSNIL
jgi:hypothetical protein